MLEEVLKKLKPYQLKTVDFGIKNPYFIMGLRPGEGKAQPLSSKILTPNGYMLMKDIRIGDLVIGKDGKFKKVTGVFPQGVKKIYKIVFTDKNHTLCCGEHLWTVYTNHNREKLLTVNEILKLGIRDKGNKNKYSIPLTEEIQFTKKYLPIHPYNLGVLIGDGSLSHGLCSFTNRDDSIIQRFKGNLPEDLYLKSEWVDRDNTFKNKILCLDTSGSKINHYIRRIKELGLNTTSYYKRIPNIYLTSSIEDRWELLAGLMDTDGYISERGQVTYSSSSEWLIDDICFLIQSLGGVARKNYKKTNFGTDSYNININMLNLKGKLSKKFKAERLLDNSDKKYLPKRKIDSIVEFGEEECQCISVEDEHYLTDNCIVTHNTLCAVSIVESLKQKYNRNINVLYICPASYKISTKHEIKKWFPHLTIFSVMDKKYIPKNPWSEDYIIINYEMLKESEHLFQWADIVICDESHFLKNTEAKRSDLLHRYVYENEIKRVMLLTGTPITNQVVDFYSQIAICFYNPKIKEPVFLKKYPTMTDFAEKFSFSKWVDNGWVNKKVYEGIRNIPELKSYLKDIYISFSPEETGKQIDIIKKDVLIDEIDNPKLLADFEEFSNSDQGDSVKSKAKKEAAIATAPFTIEYVKNLLNQGIDKIVIFSDHKDSINMIAEAFNTQAITSDVDVDQRTWLVNKFQGNADFRIICGTNKTMGAGYTLTASHHMVINDYPWEPGWLKQLMKRIDRVCQTRTPTYHFIHGSYQSDYILKKLMKKQETIDKLLK